MGCGCDSKLGHLHDGLRAADDIVSKALGVSELSQAAKVEVRDRELLYGEWHKLATEAARAAQKAVQGGTGAITQGDVTRATKAVDSVMAKWAGRVTDRHLDDIEKVYELSHIAAAKKGYGLTDARMDISAPVMKAEDAETVTRIEVSYNLADDKMRDSLRRKQTIWIGDHYDDNVSSSVRQTVIDTLKFGGEARGGGRAEVGKALKERLDRTLDEVKVPDGFTGPATKYFEGLAAHASTMARTQSQLNTFDRLGFTVYEVVNPQDSRTCPICAALDGQQFEMSDGVKLTAKLTRARTPKAVKSTQPYISLNQVKALLTDGKGTAATRGLAARGNSMPPFHYLCRCSIDVVFKIDTPAVPQPDSKGVVKVPKKRAAPRPKTDIPERAPEHEELLKQMGPIKKEWDKAWDSNDYKKARKDFEKFLDNNWGVSQYKRTLWSRDFVNKIERKPVASMPGVAGTHSSVHGLITLREDFAKAISHDLTGMLNKTGDTGYGVRTIVHEMVHGANRMSPARYTKCGEVICEATTELTARRITLDMANQAQRTAFDYGKGGSYQKYIRAIRDAVYDSTSWKLSRIEKEIERAALLNQTNHIERHAKSMKAVVDNFIDALPSSSELTEKQRKDLYKKLSALKPDPRPTT